MHVALKAIAFDWGHTLMDERLAGGEAFGIRTVWLSGSAHRSDDDAPSSARATYTVDTLYDLPALVQRLQPL